MNDLTDFQAFVRGHAFYTKEYRGVYPAIALAGEVGETLNIIKKIMRVSRGPLTVDTASRTKLVDELGDVLWYYIALLDDLDITVEEVIRQNRHKLEARKAEGMAQR